MDHAFTPPDVEEVRALLKAMVGKHVVVVGDMMLDRYLMGRIDRISPEAPVPVFEIQHEQVMLGGAANVAKCLAALGATATLCGVVGEDDHAQLLREEAVNIGLDADGLVADAARPTTLKTRVVAQRQQMIRLDHESAGAMSSQVEQRLIERVREAVKGADAVVISDYGKGVLSEVVCRAAIGERGEGRGERDTRQVASLHKGMIPVVVDPKGLPWERYRGATIIKPNRREASWFCGSEVSGDAAATAAARAMVEQLDLEYALVTRGDQGMTLVKGARGEGRGVREQEDKGQRAEGRGHNIREQGSGVVHLRPVHREVFDPTGAGDIVAAVLALAMAAGADAATAAYVANLAAAVEVSKFGTAVVSDSEILELLGEGVRGEGRGTGVTDKIMTREQAEQFAQALRRQNKRIVFTNGCFDILHVGHVNYLEQSARLGDALIVGINTDASVQRLKGPGRPIQNERDRARIIASQACVAAVVLFDEDTPVELIRAVRPDVLTKGADYASKEKVVGWDLVEGYGGRVELIDLVEGRSTTGLIEKAGVNNHG